MDTKSQQLDSWWQDVEVTDGFERGESYAHEAQRAFDRTAWLITKEKARVKARRSAISAEVRKAALRSLAGAKRRRELPEA